MKTKYAINRLWRLLLFSLLLAVAACEAQTVPETVEPPVAEVAPADPTPVADDTSADAAAIEEPEEAEEVVSAVATVVAEPAVAEPAADALADAPFRDPALPIDARVDDLLARMTLDEKIGQMTLIENGSIRPDGVREKALGAILSGGGGGPVGDNTAAAWRDMVLAYQTAALETRLGIPLIYGVDAVHGHNNVEGAVIFPHNVGLGAAANPDLMFEIGRVTAIETIATGIYWNYSPVFAVTRDIRWGRAYEAYGEDTALVSELGNALMLGLQGTDGATSDLDHPLTLLATPKHWVGDGGTGWGTSTTGDYMIDQGVTLGDESVLRQVHIPPYLPAIENGALSVMTSYSSWDGLKMHAHDYLNNEVLKGELGFPGFIVSDWQAIDQIPGDYYSDVVTAINAGIDMNMVPYDTDGFMRALKRAVTSGDVSEARIDDAVRRILHAKFALGLFEDPFGDPALLAEVGSDAHRGVARQAVRESLVLLKNDGALPLDPSVGRILVAGQHGDDTGLQSGGWTIEWQGTSGGIGSGTSILEALEASVDPSTEVFFDRFGRFEQLEGAADVGIVVLGERPYAEGIGDRADLTLNPTIIERVRERVDTVIVILITGRPLIITEALPLADAWVVAWLPGSEGAGITDVLFGDYDFSGKLPLSWPRAMSQLPFDLDQLPDTGCDAPLFPFGYGLTYSDDGQFAPPACP